MVNLCFDRKFNVRMPLIKKIKKVNKSCRKQLGCHQHILNKV